MRSSTRFTSIGCSRATFPARSRRPASSLRRRRSRNGPSCASCAATGSRASRRGARAGVRARVPWRRPERQALPRAARSIGELFERVLPALDRLLVDESWDTALAVLHGGVNRAILSYALTGERMFLGHFEQAPGVRQRPRRRRRGRVDRARGQHRAARPAPPRAPLTTMERYWASQYLRRRNE